MGSRSRASAKQAGARFNRETADYLATHVDERIDRRHPTGAKDKGDVSALRVHGQRVVVECKDYGGELHPGPWVNEAERERVNDGALAGVVVAKRRGKGDPGDQLVLLTVRDLIALLTGVRPGP